jgi:DNA-binding NarL/FixJ family response regulator
VARRAGIVLAGSELDPRPADDDQRSRFASLTRREREVLELIAAGSTNRQIGSTLYISTKTASVHVSRILTKLGAGTRQKAATIARRAGHVRA